MGNLNLRGEILTLIDLSNFLQLNTALVNQRQKAMVVQVEDVVAGIRTPKPVQDMQQEMPEMYKQLLALREKLEKH